MYTGLSGYSVCVLKLKGILVICHIGLQWKMDFCSGYGKLGMS